MKVMHYIRNEIFMIIFSGMFLLCDMNANAQQIIKSSDANDFRIGDSNDTYYIYDDLGLLRFVLSPSYQEEANLEKYGYEYRYDQRGRCVCDLVDRGVEWSAGDQRYCGPRDRAGCEAPVGNSAVIDAGDRQPD